MLRSLKNLEDYYVTATDGDVGSVVDFLFDDQRWTIRYLVVKAGGFLKGRRVLVSPIFFRDADWKSRRFHVALTRDQVKQSPDINLDQPVSRQSERTYHGYFGVPLYWGYTGLWGMGGYPGMLAPGTWESNANVLPPQSEEAGDFHLRSAHEVRGYHVQGTDEEIGHVADFIVDDESWALRYLVVDTSNWWVGKKVLVSPLWASNVSWEDQKVHFALPRESIKNSPVWDPSAPVNRQYEEHLYDYYGRPVYWTL